MKKVYQTVVDKGRGNCHQALIASIFELELSQVPNFRLYPDETWFNIYFYFLYSMGFEYKGRRHDPKVNPLRLGDSLNGCFDAAVESRTFGKGVHHAVVLDVAGNVIHDPNPNQKWAGVNVIKEEALKYWSIFEPVKK